jgi:DMSO/TMAO reductase YedYZ molybdopterin-dependent catalytic subunit
VVERGHPTEEHVVTDHDGDGPSTDARPRTPGTEDPRDDDYGFPAPLWRWLEAHPPPGVARLRWRSPLRGPWLTSVLGLVLLVTLPIVILTGLLSYIAYGPQFGQAFPADVGWFKLPTFDWPTSPSWLYRLTQGLHVGLGLILIPVVLAKLWSVIPRLFTWPPARSIAQVLERISLLMLVGGILFEIVTGVLNIQYDYVFGFSFYTAHYWGAWVFIVGFVVHISLKIPRMAAALKTMSLRNVLRTNTSDTDVEPTDIDGLVATDPDPATVSRRGALAVVGGGALLVAVLTAGQTLGGVTRHLALLLPRGRDPGDGPNDFQINRTAVAAGIDPAATGRDWRVTLRGGPVPVVLDRAALAAMPQHTARLPIACVEGWSTTETWTGVRLGDLAAMAGVPAPRLARVASLERGGAFSRATLQGNQVGDPDSLLALKVNGADLSLDHGFPARVIVPALPGVHNTKWVASIDFEATT